MYKKLNEEDLNRLMEAGIQVFAEKGFDKANIADISKKSGLSTGVLYKYFSGKDDFFLQCVRHALGPLRTVLDEVEFKNDIIIEDKLEMILKLLLDMAHNHSDYLVLYHEITSGGCRKFVPQLAEEIERTSSVLYKAAIEDAIKRGEVREDINPSMFAFFFDNVLMMLHFSMSCDYYKQRMQIYCGEIDEDELIKELVKFLTGAFTPFTIQQS